MAVKSNVSESLRHFSSDFFHIAKPLTLKTGFYENKMSHDGNQNILKSKYCLCDSSCGQSFGKSHPLHFDLRLTEFQSKSKVWIEAYLISSMESLIDWLLFSCFFFFVYEMNNRTNVASFSKPCHGFWLAWCELQTCVS